MRHVVRARLRLLMSLCAALCLAAGCAGAPVDTAPPTTDMPELQRNAVLFDALYTAEPLPQTAGMQDVAARVSPAVVGIGVRSTDAGGAQIEGIGTGFFVDQSGYILTNQHVTQRQSTVSVVLQDGTVIEGEVVFADSALDLAMVRVQGGPYPALQLADSRDLRVGEPVIAIGTPLTMQFQHTVTGGIISALSRTLEVPTEQGVSFMEELVQTDAAINPGNSGGPLCDGRGYVVGITTLKVKEAEGIGFAIPSEVAKPIVARMVAQGSYATPYIGLFVIDRNIAKFYGMQVDVQGVTVINVDPQGPAAQCGLQQGDQLLRVGAQNVASVLDVRMEIYAGQPGDEMILAWLRDGRSMQGTARLGGKPVS